MADREEDQRMLARIRERHEDRMASGQVAGVRDWFEIAFLLGLLDKKCKNCKNEDGGDDG